MTINKFPSKRDVSVHCRSVEEMTYSDWDWVSIWLVNGLSCFVTYECARGITKSGMGVPVLVFLIYIHIYT